MIGIEAVMRLIGDLQETELRRWIAERWVRPEPASEGELFGEVDVARIRLIVELRRELAIDEEGLPVVLQLLDQVYALRRRLRAMSEALDAQAPEIRDAVRARLARFSGEDEGCVPSAPPLRPSGPARPKVPPDIVLLRPPLLLFSRSPCA